MTAFTPRKIQIKYLNANISLPINFPLSAWNLKSFLPRHPYSRTGPTYDQVYPPWVIRVSSNQWLESLFTTVKSVSEGKCLEAHPVVGEKLNSSVILRS